MGTKVQYKSYSSACYSMSNFNKNADIGSWPQCYEDKNLTSGHYFDHFLQRPTDAYSERDKEELKQAMLKHEVIFRNQVYELHRLYGIQKDFMDKLKREELHKHHVAVEASHSSPFSSQIPSEELQKLWMIHQSQLARSSDSGSSTLNLVNMQSPLSFSKETSMQSSPVPTHNVPCLMKCESMESTSKKGPAKIDLQLPADEYVANEETRQIEKEKYARLIVEAKHSLKRCCKTAPENDASDGDNSCQEGASDSQLDTKGKHRLFDLNEEIQLEEETTWAVDFMDSVPCHEENQGKNTCSKPNSVFVGLSMDYLQNTWKGRDNRTYTDIQPLENKGNIQEMDMHAHQSVHCAGSSSVSSSMNQKRIPSVNPSALFSKSPQPSIGLCSEEKTWHYSTNSRSTSSVESQSQQHATFHELQSQSSLSHNRFPSVGSDYNWCDRSASSGDIDTYSTTKYLKGPIFMDVKSAKGMDLNLPPSGSLQVGIGTDVKNEEAPKRSSKPRTKPNFTGGTSKGRDAAKQMGLSFLYWPSQHSTSRAGSENQLSLGSLFSSLEHPFEAVKAPNTSRIGKFHTDLSCDLAKNKGEKALPKSSIREIIEIDLEVSADLDSSEGISTGEDSSRKHQEKLAAEALVAISSSGASPSSARDTLHWFSEVITSINDDKLSPDMDYFESMTLKITETKVDEYCTKLVAPEYPETVIDASSLMSQRCRGKGKRGGQQRNFQRDVLPGFASLSRHEVSEDLEMLEGLMRSVGHSWQIGLARKTAARSARARGKGRSRASNLIPAVSAV